MKLIHTADWHLNAGRKLPSYLERFETTMDEIADVMRRTGVMTCAISGDVTDTRLTHDEQKLFVRKFCEWDDLGFRVVVIDGNHDRIDANKNSSLDILKVLRDEGRLKNIWVVTHEPQIVEFDDVAFMCIPWFGAKTKTQLMDKLDPRIKNLDKPVVALCHEHFAGAKTAAGWSAKGKELSVPTTKHVTYWALGDIHKKQRMAPNAFYCGTPHQINFGEVLPKGVALVDTDHPTKPTFVKLEKAAPFVSIELSEWETEAAQEVVAGAFNSRVIVSEGDDVQDVPSDVNVVDKRGESSVLDFSSVEFSLEEYVTAELSRRGILSKGEVDKAVEMAVKFMKHAERQVSGTYSP